MWRVNSAQYEILSFSRIRINWDESGLAREGHHTNDSLYKFLLKRQIKTDWGWSSLVAQQVKDPKLSLQWLKLLLCKGFDPWPRNLHMPWVQKKKKKKIGAVHIPAYFWVQEILLFKDTLSTGLFRMVDQKGR